MKCRVCNSAGSELGHLFRCGDKKCGAAHWDKSAVKKVSEELKNEEFFKTFIKNAGLEYYSKGQFFVYILRLKGEANAIYVGRTGLNPYVRYLNHIRGYKSSKHARKRATALIGFEGPMPYEQSVAREKELAEKMKSDGLSVYYA